MSYDAEWLYNLLPAVYRIRDVEQGEQLRALLEVIAGQVAVLEEDLAQLYDDQFIETCAEWVVPYIGDLIGARLLYPLTPTTFSQRAQVANTLAYRRRKGTAAVLEQLARDVTGWPARVVEFFQLLATTQYLNHLRLDNHYSPDLRQHELLERLNTPFGRVAHTAEVRRIAPRRGKYNIPNVGLFLWRLQPYSLTNSPAFRLDERRYLFSPLGHNAPLCTHPNPESGIEHLAQPIHVPEPIGRRMLDDHLAAYYGLGRSLWLVVDGDVVPAEDVRACDLSDLPGGDWAHKPDSAIAIDPVLGRIAFPEDDEPPGEVRVSFHYGFSADMGGGEYERGDTLDPELQPVQAVTMPESIQDALDALDGSGVVEVGDSGRYEETLAVALGEGERLELRAANGARPLIVLGGEMSIHGEQGSELTLNGLLISGGTLRVSGALHRLRLVHCTLVPGLALSTEGEPEHPDEPSLVVESPETLVEIEHCIVGGLRVHDLARAQVANSIVDATDEEGVAYAGTSLDTTGAQLRILNSTVIGQVRTILLEEASNTIFLAEAALPDDGWDHPVHADRRQEGCVRFSYVPPGSQTPRRYKCQPASEADALRVRPQFNSLRYGDPDYGQLSQRCAVEIRQGADDEAEMGAFHDLYQPQRETNLRVALDEYLRFGLEAGIFYVT